jgi:predicted thioredoxin/glutaredoxin
MDIRYKIVTIEEAEKLDFSKLEQQSIETARCSTDGRVVISGEGVDGVSLDEIKKQLKGKEWNQNNEVE